MRSSPVVPPGRVARRDYVRAKGHRLAERNISPHPTAHERRNPSRLLAAARTLLDSQGYPPIFHAVGCRYLALAVALLSIALPLREPEVELTDPSTDPRQTRDSHAPPPGHPSTLTRQLLAAPAAPPHAVTAATA